MKQTFYDGIPLERDYRALLESDTFREMEEFSNNFVSENRNILQDYVEKWVEDPLHQWSRQWEYPFVHDRIQHSVRHEPGLIVLDAGSGITFFPYYLKSKFNGASIHCCDYDETLPALFDQINEVTGTMVESSTADLRDLSYERETFHLIYCISVLEHTDEYTRIIDEFYRVLRPKGTLVITFDISLDGTRDINAEKAAVLLTELYNRFNESDFDPKDLPSHLSTPGIFTTKTAKDIDIGLLPWRQPSLLHRIKAAVTAGRSDTWPPPVTVFCAGLKKHPD